MTKQMLQQRLQKAESTLAFQQSLNSVLQEKLMVLIRKIDERDQRVYTMATAMRKVERETNEKNAEMAAERKGKQGLPLFSQLAGACCVQTQDD